jgi:hypothetical protein
MSAVISPGNPDPSASPPQNRILSLVLALVVIVPLLAFPSNQAMQDVANKALQVMAALLAGMLILRGRLPGRLQQVIAFLGTGANLAVLLFFAFMLVSLGPNLHDPGLRRLGLTKTQGVLAGILLYFAVAYHVRRSDQLSRMGDVLVQVAGLMAILGMALLTTQENRSRANLFGDSQLFGAFLMILLPVALVLSITEQEFKRKITAQVCTVLTIIGLGSSGTRSAWIGTVVMLIALAAFSRIGARRSPTHSKAEYILPILTVLACSLFLAFRSDVMQTVGMRLSAGDSTLKTRQSRHWHAAKELLLFNPALGLGPGSYAVYQEPYSHFGRPGYRVLKERPNLSEMTHNVWLQIAAEQGLIGVGLFAAAILTFLAAGMRRLRTLEGGIRRSLLLASMAGMIGFAIDGISNPGWEFAQIAIYFWLMLGLGVACLQPRSSRSEA